MEIDSLLKVTPALFSEYVDFAINFSKNPGKTLRPYRSKGKIDSKLTVFLILGVGVSLIISLIARAIGVIEDPSRTLFFFRSFKPPVLPVVAIILILAITIIFHLSAKVYIFLNNLIPGALGANLGGTIQDSINGAFGFSAFFVPLVTLVLSVILILPKQNPAFTDPMMAGIAGVGLAVILVIYFPAALSATHPKTSFIQALLALAASLAVIVLLARLLEWSSK